MTPGVIIAALIALGAFVMIGTQFGRGPGPGQTAQQAGDDGAATAGRVATGPFRAGENVFERLGAMWNATARIEQLERENRDLQVWRELAERLAERNSRYEALLRMPADSFGDSANLDRAVAAQLVLDSGGPFTRTLVANAGADHGVRIGYIAVNENGLVGRVVSVGRRSARVLMLDDYNSRIPVMGEASRVRAVLAGQATQAPDLITRPFEMQAPRLDFIVGADSLREGERVVTSGDGGLYPRGLPVGVARRGGDGQWRVGLAASQRPIDFVRLIPYVGVERPEAAPADDAGPPLTATSSVSSVDRTVTPPPPTIAPPLQAVARPRPPQAEAAAQTPPRPAAQTPTQTPAAATPAASTPAPPPAQTQAQGEPAPTGPNP